MRPEVVSYGDDRPPRTRPVALVAGAVAVALVASGVTYAVTRDRPARRAQRSFISYPTPSPSPTEEPEPDLGFGEETVVRPPAGENVAGALLGNGTPVLLIDQGVVHAVDAFVGPAFAPTLVGWCAPLRRFEDPTATYVVTSVLDMPSHRTRFAGGGLAIDHEVDEPDPERLVPAPHPRCPDPLTYPPLPPRVTDVHKTTNAYRQVRGRYLVTHETRAFCAVVKPSGCADQGWETYGDTTLPDDDVAGSYTWEGDFLVRTTPDDGGLDVILLAGVRLRREGVAARVVGAKPRRAYRRAGALHLVTGDGHDYAVRDDATVVLGRGITGLGLPKGTTETLLHFVALYPDQKMTLALDPRGRVIRAICPEVDPPALIRDPLPSEPPVTVP